jgi:hypothetical protein
MQSGLGPLSAALVAIPVLWLLSLSDDSPWLFIFLAQLSLLPDFRRRKTTFLFALASLMAAFAATVKGTFLVAAVAVQAFVLLLELSAMRSLFNTAIWLIGLTASLASARVGPLSWARHVRHVFSSLGAYDESFSQAGSFRQTLLVAAASALIALVVLLTEALPFRRRSLPILLGYAAVLWVAYKGAVVRPDEMHVSRTLFTLAAFALVFIVTRRRRLQAVFQGSTGRPWRGRFGVAATSVAIFADLYWLGTTFTMKPISARFDNQIKSASAVLRDGYRSVATRDLKARSLLVRKYAFPDDMGPQVGVFGTFQTPLIANGKRNVPLPVAAHYEVWTPETIAATNGFLSSAAAPQYLLYTGTNQSASNALTIASRYEPVADYRTFAILRKRHAVLDVTRQLILERQATWDEVVAIPPEARGQVLLAKLSYERSALNRLVTSLYQPPRVYLLLYVGNQVFAKVRLNRLILDDGVILDAYRGTWDGGFRSLHGRRYSLFSESPTHFTGFALTVEAPLGERKATGYFHPRIGVRVEQMTFSPSIRPKSGGT